MPQIFPKFYWIYCKISITFTENLLKSWIFFSTFNRKREDFCENFAEILVSVFFVDRIRYSSKILGIFPKMTFWTRSCCEVTFLQFFNASVFYISIGKPLQWRNLWVITHQRPYEFNKPHRPWYGHWRLGLNMCLKKKKMKNTRSVRPWYGHWRTGSKTWLKKMIQSARQ